MRLTIFKTRRLSRLVRILGHDSLEEVFGYEVTMSMLRQLRYHGIFLAILKKPIGKHWHPPNKGGLKYGIRFPMNTNKTAQFDQDNYDKLWANEILKELEALMSM